MLTWYEQEHPTSCVAACVRMVLSGFGVALTEEEIHQLIGRPQLGITLMAAQAELSQAGAGTEFHDDWNRDDLRDALSQGLYPIVGVERHLLGHPPARHAIVLVSIASHGVKTLDPYDGPQTQDHGLDAFDLAWKLAGKEVLLITSPPTV